jgi:hypothetical protein
MKRGNDQNALIARRGKASISQHIVAALDEEIARLQQARALIAESAGERLPDALMP